MPATAEERDGTFMTTGRTQGLLLSSLYAPTPRSILLGWVSALHAALIAKRLAMYDASAEKVREP